MFEYAALALPENYRTAFTFERVSGSPIPSNYRSIDLDVKDGPYEYKDNQWYVIFANKHLGGGYLNQGFVQEEILMIECPELSIAVSQFDILGPLEKNEVGIYTNVSRGSEILVYGRAIQNFQGKLSEAFQRVPVTSINLLAIDAVNVSKKSNGVTKEDLEYMLDKATIGFKAVVDHGGREIYTGKWGCGVYGNDLSSIFMITMLAAQRAGLSKVIFHLYNGSGRDLIEPCLKLSPMEMEERLFG